MHLAKRRGKFWKNRLLKKNPKEFREGADDIPVQRDC